MDTPYLLVLLVFFAFVLILFVLVLFVFVLLTITCTLLHRVLLRRCFLRSLLLLHIIAPFLRGGNNFTLVGDSEIVPLLGIVPFLDIFSSIGSFLVLGPLCQFSIASTERQ